MDLENGVSPLAQYDIQRGFGNGDGRILFSSPPDSPSKILVFSQDPLGKQMAGPGIRSLEFARILSLTCSVTLATDNSSALQNERFPVHFVDDTRLRALVSEHEVIIFQGFTLDTYPWLRESNIIRVVDLYDPMQLEVLVQSTDLSEEERAHRTRVVTESLTLQLECADLVLCASEKQRDLWLGHLGAIGRLNQHTYDADPSLRQLVAVVPFGMQDVSPTKQKPAIKGVIAGISPSDKVVIWGGGIYNWFDPLTLIRAVAALVPDHPDLKLFFLGLQHPNPNVPSMRMASDAQALARDLGLIDSNVFFNKEWVEYDSRANYLLDADLGVSTHFDHVETAFSFRTRILDYLWSGLPIVSTAGDAFATTIQEHSLGIVVPPEDAEALSTAIEASIYSDRLSQFRENVTKFGSQLRWSVTARELIDFCENPRPAADRDRPERSVRELERQQLLKNVHLLATELEAAKHRMEKFDRMLAVRAFRKVKRGFVRLTSKF